MVIFLAAGEIAVRFYVSQNTFYDIEMARYATLIKMDSSNPQISHIHRPYSKARLMNVSVEINSDGFRDREHSLNTNGDYRIIFLGDSLTFGWGVELTQIFKERLEKELKKSYPTDVINFGIGNYNTEQQVSLFLEKGLKYRPDKVVVFYFINDAEPTPHKSSLSFLDHSRVITFYWSRIGALLSNLSQSNSFQNYYSQLYEENQSGWRRTREAFIRMKKTCDERQIHLQVVLLPELHNLQRYPFRKEHATVLSFLSHLDIEALDLAPFFADQSMPVSLWVARDDAHPNARAHELIARYSLEFIKRRKRGPA
ncbi:MAG: SGNH/GDSL hydrolase family protein [Deltaproteobacteria bacterium]|nr:SGNH/GDSL hydrolase family protein [Deltaproteobacteria bacterium]